MKNKYIIEVAKNNAKIKELVRKNESDILHVVSNADCIIHNVSNDIKYYVPSKCNWEKAIIDIKVYKNIL